MSALRGWRIYEGGGGVKRFVLPFVLWGGASSPPYLEVGGCERSHTAAFVPMHVGFRNPSSFRSLIYPVAVDQDVDAQPGAS